MTHTEFSRLLSEHGFFGIIAMSSLMAMLLLNLKREKSNFGRAIIIAVSTWSVMFMLNTSMRLAAPAFMWGLTFITILSAARGRGRTAQELLVRNDGYMPRPEQRLAIRP